MKIERKFTRNGADGYDGLLLALTRIGGGEDDVDDGMTLEVPAGWGQLAAEAVAKALCMGGVPMRLRKLTEKGVPEFLWSSVADEAALAELEPEARLGREVSARQVFDRYAGVMARQGWKLGWFDSDEAARSYYDELRAMLAGQVLTPQIGALATAGCDWAYGLAPEAAAILPEQPLVMAEADVPGAGAVAGWKLRHEHKVAALAVGSQLLSERLAALRHAADAGAPAPAIRAARADGIPEALILRTLGEARLGLKAPELPVFDTDSDGEAWTSLAGAGRRTALRLSAEFLASVAAAQAPRGVQMPELWRDLTQAIWATGAPQLQFAEAADGWHPEGDALAPPALAGAGRIRLNLAAFVGSAGLDIAALSHAARLGALTSAIALTLSPDEGRLSLEPTNLASALMALGLAYDSDAGRTMAGAMISLVTGAAYLTSAELAEAAGEDGGRLSPALLRLLGNFRHASYGNHSGYATAGLAPQPLVREQLADPAPVDAARRIWDEVLAAAQSFGLRHAEVSSVAPAPDEDRLLGALSFDILPLPALVRDALLPEGGYRREIAPALSEGLHRLGYSEAARAQIVAAILGHGDFGSAPAINHTSLIGHGFGRDEIARLEAALPAAGHIRHVFNRWQLGEQFCRDVLGLPPKVLAEPAFDLLAHLGFSKDEIEAANRHVMGSGRAAGSPKLKAAHAAVFDCAAPADGAGRGLGPEAQLAMLAAVSSFVAGPLDRPLTLPEAATPEEIGGLILAAQRRGLRALQLARVSGGLAQPLAVLADEAAPAGRGIFMAGGYQAELSCNRDAAGRVTAVDLSLEDAPAELAELARTLGRVVSAALAQGISPEPVIAALAADGKAAALSSALAAELAKQTAPTAADKQARRRKSRSG